MTIHEVEARCGLERASIRFYEREGLLTAPRRSNGYRDYTEENVQTLLRIRLLRSLGVSLEDIRALQSGTQALSDTLRAQLSRLEQEQARAAAAQRVCREIEAEHVAFSELDAPKYLGRLEQGAPPAAPRLPDDRTPYPRCPVRRFFARMLDGCLYTALACWLLMLLGAPLNRPSLSALLLLLETGLMLVLEPAFLHLFGTTPGKALLGLAVECEDGSRLSYAEGWSRMWSMLWHGRALGIPLLSLYRQYQAYELVLSGEPVAWDEGLSYLQRPPRKWHIPALLAAFACAFFLQLLPFGLQQLPPNRGALTPEAFVENYRYYLDYLGWTSTCELQPDGTWTSASSGGTVIVVNSATFARVPDLELQTQDGFVTGVRFTLEPDDLEQMISYPDTVMLPLSAALAGAQKGVSILPGFLSRLGDALSDGRGFVDCLNDGLDFCESGVRVQCRLEHMGYRLSDTLAVPAGGTLTGTPYFRFRFSVELETP